MLVNILNIRLNEQEYDDLLAVASNQKLKPTTMASVLLKKKIEEVLKQVSK